MARFRQSGAGPDHGVTNDQQPAYVPLGIGQAMRRATGVEQAGHDQGADVTAIRLHFAAVPGVHGGKAWVSDDDGDSPAPF